MKKVRLSESDFNRIVKRVIEEQTFVGASVNMGEILYNAIKLAVKVLPSNVIGGIIWDLITSDSEGILESIGKYKTQLGSQYDVLVNAVTKGDLSKVYDEFIKVAKSGLGN
jgi:hypothetical protein